VTSVAGPFSIEVNGRVSQKKIRMKTFIYHGVTEGETNNVYSAFLRVLSASVVKTFVLVLNPE
jgi:hypothetical protein